MSEKRIGIVMYQTSNSKGQELVAQRMVRDFRKLGQAAYLITSTYHDGREIISSEGLLKNKGYYYIEDEALHIPVIRVESALAKWPPRRVVFKDFFSTLNQIVDDFKINVLITHSTLWNGPEDVAKFVAWRRSMRQIGGYQDPIVFCHMSHFQEPSTQRYSLPELAYRTAWNKVSLTKILEAANQILVVTPMEKKAKISMGAKPEKCFPYPGGIDSESFLKFAAEDALEFLKRHQIPLGKRIIAYLGTLEERKNPLAVLKVAQCLISKPEIHFVLAGRGDSAYGREIAETARGMPNVSYIGEIDEREKILLIRSSYLNILLSKLEALGISQMEFMYAGIPVVTSGVGGQAWIVQNGIEGIHTRGPQDIQGAVEAIIRLLSDTPLYSQMSANARLKAGKFTSIKLTGDLDSTISRELDRERGANSLPEEMQHTLSKTEQVLKTWSTGTTGIAVTNRRIFLRKGLISGSILEIPYRHIGAIEYVRHYPWKVPAIGAVLSALVVYAPSLKDLLAPGVIETLNTRMKILANFFPAQFTSSEWLLPALAVLPLAASIIIFAFCARTGFILYGEGTRPVYLSRRFKTAVDFIRLFTDKASSETPESELIRTPLDAFTNPEATD